MQKMGVLLLALACALAPADGASAAVPDRQSAEFCPARAAVVPWDAVTNAPSQTTVTDRYVIQLWTTAKHSADARVILVTATEAYSVRVVADVAAGAGNMSPSHPVAVAFEHPVELRYNYVDSVGVDGAAATVCPSYVEAVHSYDPAAVPPSGDRPPSSGAKLAEMRESTGPVVTPSFVQAVSDEPCGHLYVAPRYVGGGDVHVGRYGDAPREALVRVYLARARMATSWARH